MLSEFSPPNWQPVSSTAPEATAKALRIIRLPPPPAMAPRAAERPEQRAQALQVRLRVTSTRHPALEEPSGPSGRHSPAAPTAPHQARSATADTVAASAPLPPSPGCQR